MSIPGISWPSTTRSLGSDTTHKGPASTTSTSADLALIGDETDAHPSCKLQTDIFVRPMKLQSPPLALLGSESIRCELCCTERVWPGLQHPDYLFMTQFAYAECTDRIWPHCTPRHPPSPSPSHTGTPACHFGGLRRARWREDPGMRG